jgi:two-component system, cell cycle response regulator DivK
MAADDRPTSSEPRTVLIAEDNALNLKLFRDLLEYHGYTLITATLGRAAVDLAREHRPDLILLDIQLPDITGMEVAEQLKAREETRAIPIIAVTAFAMSGDRAKVLASGCDDYLAKPFNVQEFLNIVARYTALDPPGGSQGVALAVAVPEPTSLVLLGSALLTFGLVRRRRRK